METVRGTVTKVKGAGYWVVRGTDLQSYALVGGDKELRKEGLAVEVTGEVRRTSLGLGASGAILEVRNYRVLPSAPNP